MTHKNFVKMSRIYNIQLQINMFPWNMLCDFQSESTVFIYSIFFVLSFQFSYSTLFLKFSFHFCMRVIHNSNKRTNAWKSFSLEIARTKVQKKNTHREENLLRESRLTWKNSSRNIWIEICVNGCECECDVLNRLKLQLVWNRS